MRGLSWKGRGEWKQITWCLTGHTKGFGDVFKQDELFFFLKDVKAFASHSKILAFQSSKVYFSVKTSECHCYNSSHLLFTRLLMHTALHSDPSKRRSSLPALVDKGGSAGT